MLKYSSYLGFNFPLFPLFSLGVRNNRTYLTLYFVGQYGAIQFSFSALVGCLLATILSILDSVGDYFACAKACSVPPPPRHAVNRGLTVEGLCTFVAGLVGCGHATTTYAGNIGAIGLTKVGIHRKFQQLCTCV